MTHGGCQSSVSPQGLGLGGNPKQAGRAANNCSEQVLRPLRALPRPTRKKLKKTYSKWSGETPGREGAREPRPTNFNVRFPLFSGRPETQQFGAHVFFNRTPIKSCRSDRRGAHTLEPHTRARRQQINAHVWRNPPGNWG